MESVSNTYKSDYGQVLYGGSEKVYYVGNQPFIIAFREKRSDTSAGLDNIWRVRVQDFELKADGTFEKNYESYYATSDRKTTYGYKHGFHALDGSTSPNVSGGYNQWITNYITIYPDPAHPIYYIGEVQFERFLSPDKIWEGWIDNFWIGPADQFNYALTGSETKNATTGSYYNQTKVADPVDIATGAYTYSHKDINIPTRGGIPLSFERYYNSTNRTDGPLGIGWGHTYDSNITTRTDGSVDVHYPDGKTVYFEKTETGFKSVAGVFETLTQNSDGTFDLIFKDQKVYHYDSQGRLASMTDKNGNSLTLTYNTDNQVQTVTGPAGRTLSFTYTTNGKIDSITDPLSRTVRFGYDGDGQLTTATNKRGHSTTYTYDINGMTSITDPEGHTFIENVYDQRSRVIKQYDANGSVATFRYDDANQKTTFTDYNGNTTIYTFNGHYRVTSKTDAKGNKVTFTFDNDMNQTSVTDKNGNTTEYTFDDRGNVLTTTMPDTDGDATNDTMEMAYNTDNTIDYKIDAKGYKTDYTYDTNGNLIEQKRTKADGSIVKTSYTYNSYGQRCDCY
ncbi:DUF6531 domain-containing protein [Alkalihalobacillus sp. AL-G]|uniref:DUF6531 domain-containing protein n=1 Tax=Alkalihalobacillus sp. AL-G TaxID=2926399 RepID=UPI00272D56B6|nr:DUF6531 domain-containing protein [Alkalihalobacillus sp. AL-G]WLD94477.1 DUF6531 domain-containing protein [Alkalihalobacillus sp. AL-G]